MSFTTNGYKPDEDKLKGHLTYWFNEHHLRPDQGFALLIGLEPDEKNIDALVEWGKDKQKDDNFLGWGISLLDGGEITLIPNPDEVSDRECIHPFEYEHFEHKARIRFEFFVQKFNQLYRLWKSSDHPLLTPTPLTYFVNWAKLHNFTPYWKYVAVELKLISMDSPANNEYHLENQNNADADHNQLLKLIAAISLALAEKATAYKLGDKPNVLQIALKIEAILDALPEAKKRGLGKSKIRENIKAGLELLLSNK